MDTPDLPNLFSNEYTVSVRLLVAPQGTLLVETEAETRAKYEEMKGDARIQFADQPEKDVLAQIKRLGAAEAQEIDLFAKLQKQRGKDVREFAFSFRVATIADHEKAEAEASSLTPRQEIVYRCQLAQNTFLKTDFPDFATFRQLRTDIALHVMRKVVMRVAMAQDVRAFISGQDVS